MEYESGGAGCEENMQEKEGIIELEEKKVGMSRFDSKT